MTEGKRTTNGNTGRVELTESEAEDFEALLDFVHRTRGFDFTGYKRPTLVRRVSARMAAVGAATFSQYLDFLQLDPDEFNRLFDALLVNVTAFFRDARAWEYLGSEILPKLVAEHADEPLRIWSAGCATGEEAYTLAIMLAEQLGPESLRDRVKIYGTDVDADALTVARHAGYRAKQLAGVPEELVDRYFERDGAQYRFRKDFRRAVIFGHHDLVQTAPISHIHLLVCRNTLMYFNAETQARVLARLHFALEDGGVLFLGKAEMILAYGNLFTPVDVKRRIFAKLAKDSLSDRLTVLTEGGRLEALEYPVNYRPIREAAADATVSAQVVVHHAGTVAMVNAPARTIFGLSLGDIGRPFHDLEMAHRPVELRSAVAKVQQEGNALLLEQVRWPSAKGDSDCFDIRLTPLFDHSGDYLGVALTFVDVALTQRLEHELETTNRELEKAFEELQSTNEELETTNEALQSTIEELETTNQELVSTNEELETMNAELQSTNEELQSIHEELRLRSGELEDLNGLLEWILLTSGAGVAVVDPDLRITVWNQRSGELWGIRPDEAPGRHFLNLDIGLPTEELRPALRAVLAGDSSFEEVRLEATNRKGKDFPCVVGIAPLLRKAGTVRGAIILMQEADSRAAAT